MLADLARNDPVRSPRKLHPPNGPPLCYLLNYEEPILNEIEVANPERLTPCGHLSLLPTGLLRLPEL